MDTQNMLDAIKVKTQTANRLHDEAKEEASRVREIIRKRWPTATVSVTVEGNLCIRRTPDAPRVFVSYDAQLSYFMEET